MKDVFLTFKTFPDQALAEDFAEVLQQQKIEYVIEEDALVFDPSYANNKLNKDYMLKIWQQDFTRATKAYEKYFATQLDQMEPDYYLFSFTTSELKDIVAKPDEWGSLDYQLALKLLKDRGLAIFEEEQERLRIQRNEALAKPEQETTSDIISYYIICLIIFPVGIIIGWVWAYSQKTLPDGRRLHAYDKRVQKHGKRIFTIAIALFILTIFIKLTGRTTSRLY